jgi:hypothetical protein
MPGSVSKLKFNAVAAIVLGPEHVPKESPKDWACCKESTDDRLPSAKTVTSEREAHAPLSSFSAIR